MLSITRTALRNSPILRCRSVYNAAAPAVITLKDHKYTARATARGKGRNGEVESHGDGGLKLHLSSPKEMGGPGDGQNPEQLFAMGYASCLLGAIQFIAAKKGRTGAAEHAVVHTSVHLGEPNVLGGLGLAVDIKVEGVDGEVLKAAHEICPYSRALTLGAVVNVSLAD